MNSDGLSPSLPNPAAGLGELHRELQAERRESFLVEGLASLIVGNGEADMIERDHQASFGGGLERAAS
jgi:hypothetical protein